jgi:hypothetical protein
MKVKFLYLLIASALVFSSCNQDEIDELDSRLDKVENTLGTNEPISIKFSTKDYNNADVVKNTAFYFKSTDSETSYLGDNGDGTYWISVERFSDVEWYDGAWFSFQYDPATKEVAYASAGAYFEHSNGNYIDGNFYYWQTGSTITVTVNSFDAATGKINVSIKATSTNDYGYNEYEGRGMSCDFTFKGKLGLFDENNM